MRKVDEGCANAVVGTLKHTKKPMLIFYCFPEERQKEKNKKGLILVNRACISPRKTAAKRLLHYMISLSSSCRNHRFSAEVRLN